MTKNLQTLTIDFDKFKTGKIKKLLITGFSGAGKTTVAKRLQTQYSLPVHSLDECSLTKPTSTYLDYCEDIITLENGIIEGIAVYELYWASFISSKFKEYLMSLPCIIVRTSEIESDIRAIIRNRSPWFFRFPIYNNRQAAKQLDKFLTDRLAIPNSITGVI